MIKKTRTQRKLMRKYKLLTIFWAVVSDQENHLLVMNVLTGKFRALDK